MYRYIEGLGKIWISNSTPPKDATNTLWLKLARSEASNGQLLWWNDTKNHWDVVATDYVLFDNVAGIATPPESFTPIESDNALVYIGSGAGTYTNFIDVNGNPITIDSYSAIVFFYKPAGQKYWTYTLIEAKGPKGDTAKIKAASDRIIIDKGELEDFKVDVNEAALVHNNISGRSTENTHPISAITNLQQTLDSKASTVSVETKLSKEEAAQTYATKNEIPDVSEFITNTVDNLINYYKKSETYTQQEINNLIGSISTINFTVVDSLPAEGELNLIYLIPSTHPEEQNVKDEYIWINNGWEKIGNTAVDLTNYYTKEETSNKFALKTDIPQQYVLPIASASTLGGIKIGSGLTIDENGIVSTQEESGENVNLEDSSVTGVLPVSKGGTGQTDLSNVTVGNASSVPFEGIQDKPTTLSGYGITDAMTASEINTALNTKVDASALSGYLPLSGGNITGSLTVGGNSVWHSGNFNPDSKANISGNLSQLFQASQVNMGNGYMRIGQGSTLSSTFGIDEFTLANYRINGKFTIMSVNSPTYTPYSNFNARYVLWHAGNANLDTVDWSGRFLRASRGISCGERYGVSLLGNSASVPSYGFYMDTTSNGGTYGDVTGDYALYSVITVPTTDTARKRGWIFKDRVMGVNSASISRNGILTTAGEIYAVGDKQVWHAGNFNPASKANAPATLQNADLNTLTSNGLYVADGSISNAPASTANCRVLVIATSPYRVTQIAQVYDADRLFFRRRVDEQWQPWREVYHSGNLAPATAAAAGLMSAEDRIKLNSVASALSLPVVTEDMPTTLEETDENTTPAMSATPQVCIRAHRAAQYQMQTDELLYDALEAFARNHPEYSEFAVWLEAKDRIRQEFPKPEATDVADGPETDG